MIESDGMDVAMENGGFMGLGFASYCTNAIPYSLYRKHAYGWLKKEVTKTEDEVGEP